MAVLQAAHLGDDLAVAGERLVNIMKGVGGTPNVRSGAGNGKCAVGINGGAFLPDVADIHRVPWRRWRARIGPSDQQRRRHLDEEGIEAIAEEIRRPDEIASRDVE